MRGDLPVRQPRGQGNHHVLDSGQPPLSLGEDFRLETGIPVPRHGNLHRPALTALARACAHRPQAPALIAAALRADLPGLGVPAVNVAVQTSGPVGPILADVAGSCDATLEALVRIEEAIPYPTTALARADMVLTARINSMLPADTSEADLARWRDSLGVRFSQLGRPTDALAAAREAVTAYRELAAANPDRYRPDVAASLSNLGIWFSHLAAGPTQKQRERRLWPSGTWAIKPTSHSRAQVRKYDNQPNV